MTLKEFGWVVGIAVIAFFSAIPIIATILATIVMLVFVGWIINHWWKIPKFNPWKILRKED